MVREVCEAWPDSGDAVAQEVTSLNTEDGSPHCRDESAQTDCRVAAVHAKDGSDNDRVWHCVRGAHLARLCDDYGTDEKAEEDNGDGLASSEAE